jgi:catechol 2,3-dioxygenase-like lactoylglutathione lyase family enzyme
MFSHVVVGIRDLDRALAFYDPLLAVLELESCFVERDRGWAGWKARDTARPLFIIGRPFDDRSAAPGNGQMIAFLARSRAMVDAAHAIALAQGGASEGAPGLRPEYHPDYYGAYFRDPDGNKLCVACHGPDRGGLPRDGGGLHVDAHVRDS